MHALTPLDHQALSQLAQSQTLPNVSRWAVRLAYLTMVWTRRSRTRGQLRKLDDAALHDIGVSPAHAQAECLKWFWRP